MRKRTHIIKLRLSIDEVDSLNKRVKNSGISRESYLRHLINGLVPTDLPTPDYFTMMKELHAVGNNLNQIALMAHTMNIVDATRYDEETSQLRKAVVDITNAVMLPRKALMG
jgi:hypothetical protein